MFVLFIVKCYKKYIKTFVLIPSKPLRQEVSEGVKRLDILQAIAKSWVGIVTGWRLCGWSLCDASLTASAFNGKCWGVALVARVELVLKVATGWFEVASGTTQKVLSKILEEVTSKAHVNPGVTAAVEAGQQHGDDEGRGCRRGQRETSYCAVT